MSKYIELAKKLKALAEQGVGGEKLNAEKMLSDFLRKHNISINDIELDMKNEYWFKVNTDYEKRLLSQISKNVNNDTKIYYVESKNVKKYKLEGNFMVECSVSDYIETKSKYEFYKPLMESEMKVFYEAFIQANKLWVNTPDSEEKEYTKEELKELRRTLEMASNIKKGEFHKQIEGE